MSDRDELKDFIVEILEENKGDNIEIIDLEGKSSLADYMVVASGRSSTHVNALVQYVVQGLKQRGDKDIVPEGKEAGNWVIVDAWDVIVHVFREEVRDYYKLEEMWNIPRSQDN